MRLFLDANVLFSAAHNPDGNGRAMFLLAKKARAALISSRFAVEEAARNLKAKHPERIADLDQLVASLEVSAEPGPSIVAAVATRSLPPKDAPILASAVVARSDVLVTGDRRHFGHLYGKSVQGVVVITPAQAVARLLSRCARK